MKYLSIFLSLTLGLILLISCSSNKNISKESGQTPQLPKEITQNGVTVRNLGEKVNTEYDEYAPAITGDGKILYFTSNRPNPSSSKSGEEDIWYSQRENGTWGSPRNLGPPINFEGNQGQTSISPDGQFVYFVLPTEKDNYDIFYSKLEGIRWSQPKNLGPIVNSPYWESMPTISSDGRTLIFASNRSGGYGGSDLWITKRDAIGRWNAPINLGSSINSSEDDVAPFLAADNKTLYFSSKSQPNLGGYDIFISQLVDGKWTEKQNLGIPYNSEDDDFFITVPAANDTIYFASNRTGSINGSLDIWLAVPPPKIKFQPVVLAVTGIVSEFGSNPKKPIEANLIIKDLSNDSTIAEVMSNSVTGQYYIILTRGRNYGITAKAPGYLFYTNQFDIPADAAYKELRKDIELFPLRGKRPSVRLMVFFDFDKAELRPESKTDLQNAIEFLNANPNVLVEIAGHTDKRGSDEYNDRLSQERANSVASYIIVNGKIDPERVKPVGYGKRKLIFEGDTEEIHQINRRVEMVLLKF
jgi:outer membrane protein OmpA-like peptidoglycan-associated protein/Tol biopolymer transport system component